MHEDTDRIVDVLDEIREVLLELRDRVAGLTSGSSSVEIRTSTRGVDHTSKAYSGSPIDAAEQEAIESYFRTREEIKRRLMDGFEAQVAETQVKVEAAR